MVANSLFLTIAILLTFGFWLLGELKFFIPYKAVLFHRVRDGDPGLPRHPIPQSFRRSVRS